MQDLKQMKSLTLAYMGDAVYEVYVRKHLISSGQVKPNDLHQQAIQYVKATSQAAVLHHFLGESLLTDEELGVVRRGRNAKSGSAPKHTPIQVYRYSTAFEALIGFHYLQCQTERQDELIKLAISFVEERGINKWNRK